MKYFSDVTGKTYETVEELELDEASFPTRLKLFAEFCALESSFAFPQAEFCVVFLFFSVL